MKSSYLNLNEEPPDEQGDENGIHHLQEDQVHLKEIEVHQLQEGQAHYLDEGGQSCAWHRSQCCCL